jgi:hypothetical protein
MHSILTVERRSPDDQAFSRVWIMYELCHGGGMATRQKVSQAFRPGIVVRLSEKGEAKKKAREPKGK